MQLSGPSFSLPKYLLSLPKETDCINITSSFPFLNYNHKKCVHFFQKKLLAVVEQELLSENQTPSGKELLHVQDYDEITR